MRRPYLSFLLLAVLLGFALGGCNNDVFIRPLEISADELTLDAEHPAARIRVEGGEDWRFSVAGPSFANSAGGDEIAVDEPIFKGSIRRTAGGLDLRLDRYIAREPIELTITVYDDYTTKNVQVKLLPTGSVEVLGIDYTLSSWGTFEPYTRTEVVSETHYPQGLSSPTVDFLRPEALPTVYRFRPVLSDPVGELAVSSGTVVPVPSPGPYVWDWALQGETAPLVRDWAPLMLSHFPSMPPPLQVPVGVPVGVRLMCDYECCSFYCRVRVDLGAGGEERVIDAHLMIEMPVKLYSEYELF